MGRPKGSKNASQIRPTREELYSLYWCNGLTTREIGARLGVTGTSVKRWLKDYEIERRAPGRGLLNRGVAEPTREELYRLVHVEQQTYQAIAAVYGVDHSAIAHWLDRHGIERPAPGALRLRRLKPALPNAEVLRRLYVDEHLSLEEIGEQYAAAGSTIKRLCEQYGIAIRPDGWDGGKRFACDDGHPVRSTYELRVDNWLHLHGVEHVYEPQIPADRRCRADFLANGWYIEIWGVTNSARYSARQECKRGLYRAHALPLIELAVHTFHAAHNGLWERRLSVCLTPPHLPPSSPFQSSL